MGARLVNGRYVGVGEAHEQDHLSAEPCFHRWLDEVEAQSTTDENLLSSAPLEIQKVLWEALGRWTPPVPKAVEPEPESSEPLPPLTLPRYRS